MSGGAGLEEATTPRHFSAHSTLVQATSFGTWFAALANVGLTVHTVTGRTWKAQFLVKMAVPKTLFGQTCRLRVFVSPGVCSRRTTHMRLHPRRKRRHRHCAHVSRRLCRPIWGRTPSSDHVHDPVCWFDPWRVVHNVNTYELILLQDFDLNWQNVPPLHASH